MFSVSVDSAPSGRGFSRHWESIVRYFLLVETTGSSARRTVPALPIIGSMSPAKLSLSMVASPHSPLPFHLARVPIAEKRVYPAPYTANPGRCPTLDSELRGSLQPRSPAQCDRLRDRRRQALAPRLAGFFGVTIKAAVRASPSWNWDVVFGFPRHTHSLPAKFVSWTRIISQLEAVTQPCTALADFKVSHTRRRP